MRPSERTDESGKASARTATHPRLQIRMPRLSRFAPLFVVLVACLRPEYQCRLLCQQDDAGDQGTCPTGYKCVPLSGAEQVNVCASSQSNAGCLDNDAGPPDVVSSAGEDGAALPDAVCYPTPSHCLTISPALRAGLVLWPGPTT